MKFVTAKWVVVNDLSSCEYSGSKNIRFKISMLRSDLCDCSDVYIVVNGRINVEDNNANNGEDKMKIFDENLAVSSCLVRTCFFLHFFILCKLHSQAVL